VPGRRGFDLPRKVGRLVQSFEIGIGIAIAVAIGIDERQAASDSDCDSDSDPGPENARPERPVRTGKAFQGRKAKDRKFMRTED